MATIPLTIVAARGDFCSVEFVVQANGKCPAKDFLEDDCEQLREGGKEKPESTARARLNHLFQHMASHGAPSAKRFKKEMDKLFAFSHEVRNVQVRFACFQDGNKWVVTHGFFKPGAKRGLGGWPTSEVERAESLMAVYFARK